MKISFALERSQKVPDYSKQVITGRTIKTPVALPEYAPMLREVADHNKQMKRMYDAAITNNLNQDFPLTVGSSNAEMLTSLYISRGRSRTLIKDFPIAKGTLRAFRNNICGEDPFRLEMKVGKYSADGKKFELDREVNKKIQDAWVKAGKKKECTVRRNMSRLEMYHAVIASVMRDGQILARHHRMYDNKSGYALELIESDRLQESYMGKAPISGNVIRFSIEMDKYNAPVAYWILNRHPGELFQYNGFNDKNFRERVDAKDIIHFNNIRDRAEQDIGMTEYDSVIQTLHRDRQFDIAHVTAAIWSCCKPWWITREMPTGMPYAGDPQMFANPDGAVGMGAVGAGDGSVNQPGDAKLGGVDKKNLMTPATGEVLDYGLKPVQLDPRFPIEAASTFKRSNYLEIASGLGLSEGSVSGNYEKYSFSTARAAQIPERDNFKVYQQLMILSFIEEYFYEWLKCALLTKFIDLPVSRLEEFCDAAMFHPKNWPYIQPVQDAQADIELIEARLKSPQQVLSESEGSHNAEDVLAEIAEFEQMAKDYGVELGEVTKPTIAKGEPGTITENPDDEPEQPVKNGKSRLQLNGH